MIDRIRQMFSKPSDGAQDFITRLANSDIWILAIGIRGTPVMPSITDPESFHLALNTLADYRMELSELGDKDSVFPFNFKRNGKQVLPFFSSEERAQYFLENSCFKSNLSIFQPFCLLAGFVTTPQNEKFDLVLDLCSPSERRIVDEERILLRALSPASP